MKIDVVLNQEEKAEYSRCKDMVKKGLDTFIQVGQALATIRDKKLYRQEYSTFDECCKTEWGFQRARAYQLIDASQVYNNLSTTVDILPTSERQTRLLKDLPPAQQPIAWISAVRDAGGQPSAKQVERIVKEIKPITKESQTKWGPKAAYSSSDNQTSRGDDTSQVAEDDIDQTGSPKHHKSREEQAAIGLLETLGYSVIPPEAADDPTCAYCGKPFQ